MRQTVYIQLAILLLAVGCTISCTPMDDYLKYANGKEIIYTGQVDSMYFRSGRERVVFSGYLISDPNITKVSVYWNNRKDSLILPVEKTESIYKIEESIPLKEGSYNFEVITSDHKGNKSVTRMERGNSYGPIYERGLYNRSIENVKQMENYVLIQWYNADPSSFVRLQYEDTAGNVQERIVTAEMDTTMLRYCKEASPIQMQTVYFPDAFAIDWFPLAPRTINADANYTTRYLKNSGADATGIDGTIIGNNFGYPTDWKITDAVKVDANRQGWTNAALKRERSLNFEAIKDKNIENGKAFQTFSLDKTGKYTLQYNCLKGTPSVADLTKVDVYFVVVKGKTLPDIADLQAGKTDESVLDYSRIEARIPVKGNKGHSVTFNINEKDTEITYGFVVNVIGDKSLFQVNEITLIYDAVF